MADNKLARVDSFQYPLAHVGHLNASQASSLEAFKKICQENRYYTPASGSRSASHDDETLLRYLRARKFVPNDAWAQFKDTEDWRKQQEIEKLYETIDIEAYDETRLLYPQWTGRRDKRGIPVYVFEVAGLDNKTMAAYEASAGKSKEPGKLAPKLLRLFALYENLTRFVMPLCSVIPNRPHPETPISQSNNIVDISRVGLKQFWNLKGHMQDASQLATAHYPETLDRIFIIGAPSFFPTVWNWIKRWFDPITVSKIFILAQSEVKPTLTQFIEPENIPKRYGGHLDWEWGSLPALEPEIEGTLSWTDGQTHSVPIGPIKWRQSSDGHRLEAVAVGSQGGQRREQILASVPARKGIVLDAHTMGSTQSGPAQSTEHTDPANIVTSDSNATKNTNSSDNSQTRVGTSQTKYVQQSRTLADGQLEPFTPETRDNGQGDKTTTSEPATVGQAAKDVQVPDAKIPSDQSSPTYIEQARAAIGAAAGMASGMGASVIASTGLGPKDQHGSQEHAKEASSDKEEKAKDSRVDALDQQEVEKFIRSRYETNTESIAEQK